MRILLLTNVFPSPLQPTKGPFNFELARAVSKHHELEIISPISWWEECQAARQGRAIQERTRALGGIAVHYPRFYYLPKLGRTWYGWFMWRSVQRTVERVLRRRSVDVVVGYWAHPDGYAAVRAARLAGVPAVVMVGGSDVLLLAKDHSRRERIVSVLREAEAVITVSGDLKRCVQGFGIPESKIHVVYRGIDTEQFRPGDRREARRRLGIEFGGPVLVWVGRMVPVKGLDTLLKACEQLRNVHGRECRTYLVGDGPLRSSLQRDAAVRGLDGQVVFAGVIPHAQLPDYYRAADLAVLPSLSEGVPNVLLESIACGTRFVASAVGGVPEIASAADILVPAGDAAALAAAIDRGLAFCPREERLPFHPTAWSQVADQLTGVVERLRVGAAKAAVFT